MLSRISSEPSTDSLLSLEECIDRYIADRRGRIGPFVDRHFSLQDTIVIQKRSFLIDLLCYPINTLWAIPYVFVKKTGESLGKLGWETASRLLSVVPSGMKRRYQKEIERSIRHEILEWPSDQFARTESPHALLQLLKSDERVAPLLAMPEFSGRLDLAVADINRLIESYGANRTLASDLAGSFLTLATGWLMFGDHSLGIEGIGERIASRRAKEKAASSFILGSGLGSVFYSVFPPKPSLWEIVLATAAVGLLLTICGMMIGVLADPIMKRLGLHQRQLHALLDDIEERLYRLRRQVKPAIKQIASRSESLDELSVVSTKR
jgi:hypothetical protein